MQTARRAHGQPGLFTCSPRLLFRVRAAAPRAGWAPPRCRPPRPLPPAALSSQLGSPPRINPLVGSWARRLRCTHREAPPARELPLGLCAASSPAARCYQGDAPEMICQGRRCRRAGVG